VIAELTPESVSRVASLAPLDGLQRPLRLLTHCPQSDLVSRKIHEEGVWEPFESRLWLAAQRPGDVVVDVGANLGYFSVLSALHRQPARQILAFEPAGDNFALLTANLRLNRCESAVEAVQAALGAKTTVGTLHRSDGNLGDHQIYPGDGERAVESISLLHGSEFLSDKLERIDLLKVDTQGSEAAVIEGLLPLLKRSRESLRILIELTPFSLSLAGSSGRALLMLLAQLNQPFAIVDHLEARLVPCSLEALCEWSDNVASVAGDRGFMNIFVGSLPPGIPATAE
jgi:FkbM family methyltransferase